MHQTWQAILIIDDEPDDELAPHFTAYRRFGAVTDACAREQGTLITIGLHPDSLVQALIIRERKQALAAWEGTASDR